MLNIRLGAVGARAATIMRLLASPAPQHCTYGMSAHLWEPHDSLSNLFIPHTGTVYSYTYRLIPIKLSSFSRLNSVLRSCLKGDMIKKKSIDIEYRVSNCKIMKCIGVSISNTGIEVSEKRISNREKSIVCPALDLSNVFF
jgi:hypothetical protein